MKIKFLSVIHLLIIVLAYSSPFWLDWKLFLLGLVIYYIQVISLGGCVLSYAQYGDYKESFSTKVFSNIFELFNINVSKKKINYFLTHYLPVVLVITCILWQLILRKPVLISI